MRVKMGLHRRGNPRREAIWRIVREAPWSIHGRELPLVSVGLVLAGRRFPDRVLGQKIPPVCFTSRVTFPPMPVDVL
jgi:hypothetical protein